MPVKCSLFVATVLSSIGLVIGNGYMIDPPARASMWRVGYNTPIDYDDMNINCGGFYIHYYVNGGLCGLCGDRYDGPRHHEAGGKYAKGVITKTFKQGGIIPIRVNLTSSHGGWFEFRLCENNDVTKAGTKECFEMNLLKLKDEADTRFTDVPSGGFGHPASVLMEYQLPSGVLCNHCILQWIYNTGKDWGCAEGVCALGLGTQEQFVGCSDIGITVTGDPVDDPNGTQTGTGSTRVTETTTHSTRQTTTRTANDKTTTVSNGPPTTTRGNSDTKTTTQKGGSGGGGSTTTSTQAPITTTTTPKGVSGGGGSTTTSTQVPITTTTPVPILACQAIGVLQGEYDQLCRDMCYTTSKCSVVFCNDMCHLRAKQLDDCKEKGVCPTAG